MNTFGTIARQVPLVALSGIQENRRRFRRGMLSKLALANSLYVPIGRQIARGWILLSRKNYDLIRGYGNTFQLTLDTLTFKKLAIVQARCVTTGVVGDPNAIYLVEITDRRGLLKNTWFQYPTNSYYNVLAPAYPTLYYVTTLNPSTSNPWSWSEMVSDLWTASGFLGTYPGLPIAGGGAPVNWYNPGVSLWDTMCNVLEHLGCGVACDLTQDSPYSIVSLGADDAVFDRLVAAHKAEDDAEWIDVGSGRVPGSVTVYFRRKNQYYGTEETVTRDGNQWSTNAVYSTTLAAPAAFTGAQGIHFLWDDFCVGYDTDGTPLAADVTTAGSIASARVSQYFDNIYSRTSGYMNRTYSGVLPFYAGSQVDGVCWKYGEGRAGWITQILRGDLWPEVYSA